MQITKELIIKSMRSLWQEEQNQIPHIQFEDNFFGTGMRQWHH